MKGKVGLSKIDCVITVAFFSIITITAAAETDDEVLNTSRLLTQSYGAKLKTALEAAIAEGGPVKALDVCKDIAPQIASELSRQSGAKVTRVSRRFRNPNSAPEAWQTAVLEDFESDTYAETPLPEHVERYAGGTRYMKAIRMQSVCLVCHGEELSDDVRDAIDANYPHDRARGYALGDLRGAFSISWPAPENVAKPDVEQ